MSAAPRRPRPDDPGVEDDPPIAPPLLRDEEVARLYRGQVYEDAKMTEKARLERTDLPAVARAIVRQMLGPNPERVVCNCSRAVEIILDGLRFAAGQRTSPFGGNGWTAARATAGRRKALDHPKGGRRSAMGDPARVE